MDVSVKEFESFEQQFKDLISEFQTISTSENHLRTTLRAEAGRAEAAEAARDAALRASAESQASAAAATAGAAEATKSLAAIQDELVNVKMQLELSNKTMASFPVLKQDRQRTLFEENYVKINNKLNEAERELQQLRPLQSAQTTLKQQYIELENQIQSASAAAKNEASRLEQELRRVERCAGAGAEVRERARLAASAHTRERRLNTAELRHTTKELQAANGKVTHLTAEIVELQCKLSKYEENRNKKMETTDVDISVLKEALEAERLGTARLEKTLASALADNAALAAQLNNNDNELQAQNPSPDNSPFSDICPINSFLAE